MPKLLDTSVPVGMREVPCYECVAGESVRDAAHAMGLRLLGRREMTADREAEIDCAIEDGAGLRYFTVRA